MCMVSTILLLELNKQMRLLHNATMFPEQKRDKARATLCETREKVAAVLAPEQKEKPKQHLDRVCQQPQAQQKESQPTQ